MWYNQRRYLVVVMQPNHKFAAIRNIRSLCYPSNYIYFLSEILCGIWCFCRVLRLYILFIISFLMRLNLKNYICTSFVHSQIQKLIKITQTLIWQINDHNHHSPTWSTFKYKVKKLNYWEFQLCVDFACWYFTHDISWSWIKTFLFIFAIKI